jgi:hypothetical protein
MADSKDHHDDPVAAKKKVNLQYVVYPHWATE